MKTLNRNRLKIIKLLALLSQVRWYNVSLLLLGQYLTACFVFAPRDLRWHILLDINTHLIAWSGAFIMAFGFLINSFYDYAVDTINRPKQSAFERLVSKRTSLKTAIFLLVFGLFGAFLVNFKAFVFFGLFSIGLWYYSHRLKNLPIVSHTSAAILALTPFFGMSVYHNFSSIHTFAYGALLGLCLFSREMLKDLLMVKGDVIIGRKTIASEFGEDKTRFAIMTIAIIAWIPALFVKGLFSPYAEIGIFIILVLLSFATLIVLKTSQLKGLRWAHLIYKVILVIGVLNLPFL